MLKGLQILVMAIGLGLTVAGPVMADHKDAYDAVQKGEIMPLGKIVGSISRSYPGELLNADLVQGGIGPVYLLRWLTPQGNVLNIRVNAKTGRVLNVKGMR